MPTYNILNAYRESYSIFFFLSQPIRDGLSKDHLSQKFVFCITPNWLIYDYHSTFLRFMFEYSPKLRKI